MIHRVQKSILSQINLAHRTIVKYDILNHKASLRTKNLLHTIFIRASRRKVTTCDVSNYRTSINYGTVINTKREKVLQK